MLAVYFWRFFNCCFILLVDERYFFLYTYILLWRYGQVVKTSASQAEIEGSTPSSATSIFQGVA